MNRQPEVSSRIVIAMRDYAARQIGDDIAGEVFENACRNAATSVEDAQDPRGWVSVDMFHKLAGGLEPLVRGDLVRDAVAWIVPARRELSSMSLTALARPSLFYRQLDRARGFYAKHLRFTVAMTSGNSADVRLDYREGLPSRPESCAVARGVLTSVPLLFHMPAATVHETECFANGAEACQYQVRWKRTPRHALTGALVGGVLASLGAALIPTWWWLLAPIAGWIVGRMLIGSQRRDHMRAVIEEQRVALGTAESDLERRFREVHELKATLETVEKAQSEILDAGVQALLGELVGEFAHEMRNPMSSVLFNLSFLEGVDPAPRDESARTAGRSTDMVEVEAVLGDIRYGVEPMRGVLAWFVDVFHAGGQEPGLVSLDTEVERAAGLLQREWAGRIDIHVSCGDTPMIRSFGKEVVQVLINLLVNAANATKRGNIWIETRLEDERVVLDIRDDGIGMAPKVLERAFERGFSTSRAGPNRGRGLGLFICKRITERNGGTINLTSELGAGTAARVTFPIAEGPDAPGRLGPFGSYAP